MTRSGLCIVLALSLAACGPDSRDSGDDGTGGDAGGSGSGNQDGCSDAAKLVYVVDANGTFSKFDPATKTFQDLGQLDCPAASFISTPFSMGIDRNAVAWVLYDSGELFRVDTMSLACTKTTWASSNGLMQFGMGFSTDTAGGTTDTLFVAGGSGGPTQPTSTLAKLNTTSFSSMPVGSVTGWPELTGTGSAELWGFFPDATSAHVSKIDKTTGALTTNFPLNLAGTPAAWAFAFWGGDFWIFLMRQNDSATTVYQISSTNGMMKGMTPTSTRRVVGAGVSTCAPVVIL